jgi:hypothetical protein
MAVVHKIQTNIYCIMYKLVNRYIYVYNININKRQTVHK